MDNERLFRDEFREMVDNVKMFRKELDDAYFDHDEALDTIRWYEERLPAIEANLIGFASK